MNAAKPPDSHCRVSIIIKALNEERRIAAAIESALAAATPVGGEVILADSCSSDSTIEIAARYPIQIVQLENPLERCCGIGPQLGYQHSKGEFVYIMDGDMEMLTGFLHDALEFLATHPDCGGVGGQVVEQNTASLEYIARSERSNSHMNPGEVNRLEMGGLYRREAIQQAGYFSDRNLHSYEEFDLAIRLRSLGWRLWRIATPAVNHYGHDISPYQLLMRRWRNKYICGLGELIRNGIGRPHFALIFSGTREIAIYGATAIWWLLLMASINLSISPPTKMIAFAACLSAPVMIMIFRKRSLERAVFSVISWNFNTAGLIRGLLSPKKPTSAPIECKRIK